MKLGHIGIPVRDITASKIFYDAIAPHVGLKLIDAHDDFVGYGEGKTYDVYVHTAKAPVSGVHLCFSVDTKERVESFMNLHWRQEALTMAPRVFAKITVPPTMPRLY